MLECVVCEKKSTSKFSSVLVIAYRAKPLDLDQYIAIHKCFFNKLKINDPFFNKLMTALCSVKFSKFEFNFMFGLGFLNIQMTVKSRALNCYLVTLTHLATLC